MVLLGRVRVPAAGRCSNIVAVVTLLLVIFAVVVFVVVDPASATSPGAGAPFTLPDSRHFAPLMMFENKQVCGFEQRPVRVSARARRVEERGVWEGLGG